MCWACFKEYADAPVVNERVVAAYRLIKAQGSRADSSRLLHILVADMNLEDWWFPLDGAENAGRCQDYAEATDWERAIFDALAALSEEERATAVAMDWGYLDEAGTLREDLR